MTDAILRPIFFETQILAAADLNESVNYGRAQLARHERYEHLWGIAQGLDLKPSEKTDAAGNKFVDVLVGSGIAINGQGLQIIVPEPETLDTGKFNNLNVAIRDPDAYYPVFLVGVEEPAPGAASFSGACTTGSPTRERERFEITFGPPGSAQNLDDQLAPAVADALGDSTESSGWKILLGFVQWNDTLKKFTAAVDSADGVRRRYAGVQADEVAARGGRLTLRSRPANQGGKPALVMDDATGELQFGAQNANGDVRAVFKVDASGNITADGQIKVSVQPGSILVQSGQASDGTILPLPPGITEEQVTNGQVTVFVHVTPAAPGSVSPSGSIHFPTTLECRVDGDRRLRCTTRWFTLTAGALTSVDRPSAAIYTVIVSGSSS